MIVQIVQALAPLAFVAGGALALIVLGRELWKLWKGEV